MTKIARLIDTNPMAMQKLMNAIGIMVSRHGKHVDLDIRSGDIRPGVNPLKTRVGEIQQEVEKMMDRDGIEYPAQYIADKARYAEWLAPKPKATGKALDASRLPAATDADRMLDADGWRETILSIDNS